MTKSKILWDLYEHNFQFELVALDHVMMPSLWLNRDSERLDHVQQVCTILPHQECAVSELYADFPW
ncbi:hypothetical protein M404DRAFT_139674 [Pisolithus tinctorius Marx 270]|uniref:Uncharacterized protein n=1 Tax=Pisolithus tinctorius Marx 270 TaxID=870435 RepID=A0A0C3JAL7_PISTI|nr:hypothetical protein M404DRAFT_139674 [Pisolithus tinctorius Marx 270]